MRVVYVTLEFVHPFSGNGTASQSFVRSLLRLGDHVCVVCAVPAEEAATGDTAAPRPVDGAGLGWLEDWSARLTGICLPVDTWRRHGRDSPWLQFANAAGGEAAQEAVSKFAAAGKVDAVVGVDWEATAAAEKLTQGVGGAAAAVPPGTPYVYYNYRVYFENTGNSEDDVAFYRRQESLAVAASGAACCICLCQSDREKLRAAFGANPHVLLPALRDEVQQLAAAVAADVPRRYLLCCVRVVPEKNVAVFAEAVGLLGPEWLRSRGLVPCMVGAAASAEFAAAVRGSLKQACAFAETDDFLATGQLAALMSQSVLNVHPALNEAFGMTIVEAAAMGCPSLVHRSEIGATDLLEPGREVLTCDMSSASCIASRLRELFDDGDGGQHIRQVAAQAREKALAYDEMENGRLLRDILLDPQPPQRG
ncbi:unnamed protein product [Prorocentrum cordatum]|uniref:Glycosyl transferase family 1 domain-containing protein n=1 Tax=Prorocentrum cordatum TaxID=2364126 RepID=A0ABN9UZ03_9DINO|nr:unnamed protein product [Polarella glacialis]